MNPITKEEYGRAITTLFGVAEHDSSSGRAAAQVLLSAYNGNHWQLDVTDLCFLDGKNYEAALKVIRGRTELMREPQYFIDDGDNHFLRLWNQWKRYHILNRHLEQWEVAS